MREGCRIIDMHALRISNGRICIQTQLMFILRDIGFKLILWVILFELIIQAMMPIMGNLWPINCTDLSNRFYNMLSIRVAHNLLE